ncbi:hypothetical protein [Microcystis phage Mwe-JY25]
MNWPAEVWIAFITSVTAVITGAIALFKPKAKDDSPKAPVVLMRFDADHVPTAKALDNVQRIADAADQRKP